MLAETDTTPIVVTAWTVGAVGVLAGLCVAATGRAKLLRHRPAYRGPYVRVLGLATAAFAVAVTWAILSSPVLK
ncbi:MAG: hypothetical protein U0746_16645 [Gemmataceae bacterium]